MKTTKAETTAKKISRKDALKKAGMYVAFTAAASMVLLAPKMAQASSPPNPGWGASNTPPGGGNRNQSPFTKPDQNTNKGDRNSPWK